MGLLALSIQGVVADRQKAREERDFKLSDDLCDKIAEAGFRVEDTAGVPRV